MLRSRPRVEVVHLGRICFGAAERLQEALIRRHREGSDTPQHALLLCEHPPVFTTGLRQTPYPPEEEQRLRLLGADFRRTNRGGLITFHGPGQLVVYPVLSLVSFRRSVRWYVQQLEETVIRLCGRLGISGSRSPHTGVWVGDNKICAIGIHCGRYVTSHGLALNCNTELDWFQHVVPCGIEGKGVTSLSVELGRNVTTEETIPYLLESFRDQFDCELWSGA